MQLRAQIGVEHTALLAVVFTVLVTGFVYFATTGEEYQGLAFRAITNAEGMELVEAVEKAPLLGQDSRQVVEVELPEDFKKARMTSSKTIVMDINTKDGIEQLVFVSKYDMVDDGAIANLKPGATKIYVTVVDAGVCLSTDTYCGDECGDGIASLTETCDLADLKAETCITQGFSNGGKLVCSSDCQSFDTGWCIP